MGPMKLLHTSDWHIGRTFHGHPTLPALRTVLGALVEQVRREGVDVVLVAGDVFDSAVPAGEHFDVLSETLRALRAAGAVVVVTSGNHDSAARLGFQSGLLADGVHILTRPEQILDPVVVHDAHGPVAIYGIPYLEPALHRHRVPEGTARGHDDVLAAVMTDIRTDAASRGGRSIVLAHCFAVGVPAPEAEAPRDITRGGLDYVTLERFDGPDYVALGHVHGRQRLSERVHYSGAPLHFTFGEAGKPRGSWLVELGAEGLVGTRWLELPVPRPLAELRGTLAELLADEALEAHREHWVRAIVTDRVRPLDAMAQLQKRFPYCAALDYRPEGRTPTASRSYAERVREQPDEAIIDGFLDHVRGAGASPEERVILDDVLATIQTETGR